MTRFHFLERGEGLTLLGLQCSGTVECTSRTSCMYDVNFLETSMVRLSVTPMASGESPFPALASQPDLFDLLEMSTSHYIAYTLGRPQIRLTEFDIYGVFTKTCGSYYTRYTYLSVRLFMDNVTIDLAELIRTSITEHLISVVPESGEACLSSPLSSSVPTCLACTRGRLLWLCC